jgi:hypothetical protein
MTRRRGSGWEGPALQYRKITTDYFVVATWGTSDAESAAKIANAASQYFTRRNFASFVLAEDFKTINGKEYKNVTVSRVEADGIVLKSKSAIAKVYFVELPTEVQQRFHYNPASAAAQIITAESEHDGNIRDRRFTADHS